MDDFVVVVAVVVVCPLLPVAVNVVEFVLRVVTGRVAADGDSSLCWRCGMERPLES